MPVAILDEYPVPSPFLSFREACSPVRGTEPGSCRQLFTGWGKPLRRNRAHGKPWARLTDREIFRLIYDLLAHGRPGARHARAEQRDIQAQAATAVPDGTAALGGIAAPDCTQVQGQPSGRDATGTEDSRYPCLPATAG